MSARRMSRRIKPCLTQEQRLARLRWIVSHTQKVGRKWESVDFANTTHIDEKWLYVMKDDQKIWILPEDGRPGASKAQSKAFIKKVMFLAAVGGSQNVAASFLESLRLGNDRRQCLSSDFVAQVAATLRFERSHTDAFATATGSWKGAVGQCTPQAVCQRRCYTAGTFSQHWSNDQIGRVPFIPIYLIPISSGTFRQHPSRNLQKSAELSGLFWAFPDPSRSFFCTAVLAQRAHWYMCRL